MSQFAIQRVRATPEALELIERLVEEHGPVAFFQSGDCGEGNPAICLTRAELLPTDQDLKLGEIGGAPFYIDAERYERSDRPSLVIDVAPGSAGSFPLGGLEEIHFVTRTPDAAPVSG
jgi:uncharacterized protein